MPRLVPGIHVLCAAWKGVDGRDKPGHDDVSAYSDIGLSEMSQSFPVKVEMNSVFIGV
ncbi:hypothetical protein ABH994_006818 [Bradyrhizobium yuanmingense]